jgi:glycerol-3-phosphate acyltransferase PlsY
MVDIILWALAAYLLGSVPTAYLAGRLTKGIDIRDYGSGNVGGANALATIGLRAGILVALVDVGKGALAVGLARWLGETEAVAAAAAVAVTAGHNWSVFLGFTGGRGVGGPRRGIVPGPSPPLGGWSWYLLMGVRRLPVGGLWPRSRLRRP